MRQELALRLRLWREMVEEYLLMGALAWVSVLLSPLFMLAIVVTSWRAVRLERKRRARKAQNAP